MQTFLPYADFKKSAACLDRARLGKQRVEAVQILSILLGKSQGYKDHPAVRMWAGYEDALAIYALSICSEWKARGYQDTVIFKIIELVGDRVLGSNFKYLAPKWLGDERLHYSHRSRLKQKDPVAYMWIDGDLETDYWWPK